MFAYRGQLDQSHRSSLLETLEYSHKPQDCGALDSSKSSLGTDWL